MQPHKSKLSHAGSRVQRLRAPHGMLKRQKFNRNDN